MAVIIKTRRFDRPQAPPRISTTEETTVTDAQAGAIAEIAQDAAVAYAMNAHAVPSWLWSPSRGGIMCGGGYLQNHIICGRAAKLRTRLLLRNSNMAYQSFPMAVGAVMILIDLTNGDLWVAAAPDEAWFFE